MRSIIISTLFIVSAVRALIAPTNQQQISVNQLLLAGVADRAAYDTYPTGDTFIRTRNREAGSSSLTTRWRVECLDGEALIGVKSVDNDFKSIDWVWCKKLFKSQLSILQEDHQDNSAPYVPKQISTYPYYNSCTRAAFQTRKVNPPDNDESSLAMCNNNNISSKKRKFQYSMVVGLYDTDASFNVQTSPPVLKCCQVPKGYRINTSTCETVYTHDHTWQYYDGSSRNSNHWLVRCRDDSVMTGIGRALDPNDFTLHANFIECCQVEAAPENIVFPKLKEISFLESPQSRSALPVSEQQQQSARRLLDVANSYAKSSSAAAAVNGLFSGGSSSGGDSSIKYPKIELKRFGGTGNSIADLIINEVTPNSRFPSYLNGRINIDRNHNQHHTNHAAVDATPAAPEPQIDTIAPPLPPAPPAPPRPLSPPTYFSDINNVGNENSGGEIIQPNFDHSGISVMYPPPSAATSSSRTSLFYGRTLRRRHQYHQQEETQLTPNSAAAAAANTAEMVNNKAWRQALMLSSGNNSIVVVDSTSSTTSTRAPEIVTTTAKRMMPASSLTSNNELVPLTVKAKVYREPFNQHRFPLSTSSSSSAAAPVTTTDAKPSGKIDNNTSNPVDLDMPPATPGRPPLLPSDLTPEMSSSPVVAEQNNNLTSSWYSTFTYSNQDHKAVIKPAPLPSEVLWRHKGTFAV